MSFNFVTGKMGRNNVGRAPGIIGIQLAAVIISYNYHNLLSWILVKRIYVEELFPPLPPPKKSNMVITWAEVFIHPGFWNTETEKRCRVVLSHAICGKLLFSNSKLVQISKKYLDYWNIHLDVQSNDRNYLRISVCLTWDKVNIINMKNKQFLKQFLTKAKW